MEVELRNTLIRLIKNAMFDAARTNDCIAPENGTVTKVSDKHKILALSYANSALSYCCAAQSLYYARMDELENAGLPDLFHLFSKYVHAVQQSFVESQSSQQPSDEYDRLQHAFLASIGAEPIIRESE